MTPFLRSSRATPARRACAVSNARSASYCAKWPPVDSGQLAAPTTIGAGDVKQYLGRSRFTSEVAERTDTPGIATGLAVTGIGGDVLFIDAAHMAGDQGLTLTGQLGDVMKESVQIALSYVRSHAADLGIDAAAFKDRQF